MSEWKTNVELVTDIMQIGGRTGAMKQLVIMTAIEHYVDLIIKDEERIIEEWADGLIVPESWVESCKEIKEMIIEERSR